MNGSGFCTAYRQVQTMYQYRSFENDANPRVTMTMDSPLMALGQTKSSLQIEIVPDLLKFALTNEKAGEKASHYLGLYPDKSGLSLRWKSID